MMMLFQMAGRFWGRISFAWLAAVVGVGFALAGVAVVDDYGVALDESGHRNIAVSNVDYIMGDGDALPESPVSFYSVVFDLPLLMAERGLGLEGRRDIYLMRHLLTHLFYIVGSLFCGLLVYRMFGSRWVALAAMLLFLLHPRLYAHSFFNGKDIPFMVMFVIALYLTHRAFRRDTMGAFALLGAVVGLAVDLRPFALLLFAAVLAMRGLDWWLATNSLRRRRVLVTGGVFAGSVLLAVYVSHPYYWENPLRFFDGLQTLSRHPVLATNLFMGENIRSDVAPPEYVPVWFGITAPLGALLLGGLGGVAALAWGIRRPGGVLRDGRLRFMFLVLGCFALPVVVVVAGQFNIYNGWRQMYFLWVPFCLLAAAGLYWLAGYAGGGKGLGYLGAARRAGGYVLAGAALVGAAMGVVSLHPHQYAYFNLLVDWGARESIGERFDIDYWGLSYREGIEHLLEKYPQSPLYIFALGGGNRLYDIIRSSWIMSDDMRKWLFFVEKRGDFYMANDWASNRYGNSFFAGAGDDGVPPGPVVYSVKTRDSAFLTVTAPGLADSSPGALAEVYRAEYREIVAGELMVAGMFDVYISGDGGTLGYAKTDCATGDTERAAWFFLHVIPKDARDLPAGRGEYGFDNRDFAFYREGGRVDDKCWARAVLPDYPIALIRTGQTGPDGEALWRAEINMDALARFDVIEAGLAGLAAAGDGFFELYWEGDRLVYYRDSCAAGDTRARFFLHIFPADGDDLPVGGRGDGFDNRGFDFGEYGAHRGEKCLAEVPLPGYEIGRIRTGQYAAGEGEIWVADLAGGG